MQKSSLRAALPFLILMASVGHTFRQLDPPMHVALS